MGKIVIVTGIPGTGKTTVCNELSKLTENSGKKISVINYGSVMVNLTEEQGKLFHRDKLRKSQLFFQRGLQAEAAETIALKTEKKAEDIVIDTHMSIKTTKGYWAGLPFHVLQILKPDIFVLIETDPHEVLHRRLKDVTRKRDNVLKSDITEEFTFSRLMAATCAVLTGASVKIVKNPPKKQIKAAKEILKLLE